MKKFKVVISLLLTLLLITSSSIIANADNNGNQNPPSEYINGVINCSENEDVDFTDIEIEVFSLELKNSCEEYSEYTHVYETTVSPDENGEFTITRPSENTYVRIKTESIPSGFGIDIKSRFIPPSENEINFTIESITDFKVDFVNDKVDFYGESKKALFVDTYSLEYDDKTLKEAFLNDDPVSVSCVFDDFTVVAQQQTAEMSISSRIDYLYDNNIISEEERVRLYINNLRNNRISDESEMLGAFGIINSYTMNNEPSEELEEELENLRDQYIPTYTNEATFTASNGYFTIHYESGSLSSGNQNLISYYLEQAKTTLCSTYNFDTPAFKPGETSYHVYITEDLSYSGQTIPYEISGNNYSHINISINRENNVNNKDIDYNTQLLTNYKKASFCHEFMHAVQVYYGAYLNTQHYDEMKNFCEAVACSLMIHLVDNCNLKRYVGKFQATPYMSLLYAPSSGTYAYRCYGALLFPLSIEQDFDSFNTIREIYEENQSVGDVYTAIDNVLQNENSSLSVAYMKCALYNYNIQNYYNCYESTWQTTPSLTELPYTPVDYEQNILTTNYFEITDTSYEHFAFSFDSTDYLSKAALQSIRTTNGVLSNFLYSSFAQNTTITFNSITGSKICFLVNNKSIDSYLDYSAYVY